MDEILMILTKASGDIWSEFKNYCKSHDFNSEGFFDGLISVGDQLDDKYSNTPIHKLQTHLFAGLVDALCELEKENNEQRVN